VTNKTRNSGTHRASTNTPELLPVFLKLAGKRVLVVGGGPVAASKIASLVAAGAEVIVVAPVVHASIAASPVAVQSRRFRVADLDRAWLVVAAATPAVNRAVARAAARRRVFVNAVDDPANASAYLGGVVRRSGVTIAISTDGTAPAIAGLLREGLDRLLPGDLDRWMRRARAMRATWRRDRVPMAARRPQLLQALDALYRERRSSSRTRAKRRVA
jgi:uroporphyrin-III C-methyltransferase/precorrin-2 dehydrogenase/sirohydrochlorin ferrochelatase